MNFLAHTALAPQTPLSIVGNLLGDFVKGTPPDDLPEEVRTGIFLHRQIDTFTDSHPLVIQTKSYFPAAIRKYYAGILTDVFYDHILAQNWYRYYPHITLREHCDFVNTAITMWLPYANRRFLSMMNYVLEHDLLFSYATREGIERVLKGMQERMRRRLRLDKAPDFSFRYYEEYKTEWEENFFSFYPLLQDFVIAAQKTK